LQEVGEIMHLAGSGRVIVQLSKELVEGQILCDKDGTRVAKVMELIGPVKRPFASATPLTNNIKKYVGKSVFASEELPVNSPKKFRRRKK
jgi:RNA-binding protein